MKSPHLVIAGAAAFGALLFAAYPALAQCPEGTVQIGEQEQRTGNVITVHPMCQRVPASPPAARIFRPSGSGLVGGLGARFGYYSPVGASPEVRARALQMLRDQDRISGRNDAEAIDLERYNFAIGVAKETAVWEGSRVLREQLQNGQFTASPNHQSAYNRLRDRQFNELGCHSNGAMTCLAALMNGDVRATNVVLYGPQITVETMAMWNELLTNGDITSLRIVVAENDPVPAFALLYSPGALSTLASPLRSALAAPLVFNVRALERAIGIMSPRTVFGTFSCGTLPSEYCHEIARYSDHGRRCRSAQNPSAAGRDMRLSGHPNRRSVADSPSPNCP
jgi:hypothetical protein